MCCGRTWVTAGVEAAVERLYQEEKEARRGEEGERESGLREERLGALQQSDLQFQRSRTRSVFDVEPECYTGIICALLDGGSHFP